MCGFDWLEDFLEKIPECQRKLVKTEDVERNVFNDGKKHKPLKAVYIPIKIGQNKGNLKTLILNSSLPLLLCLQSLEKLKANIKLSDNALCIGIAEECISLERTSSGHLVVSVSPIVEDSYAMMCVGNIESLTKKQIEKLHRQFGYCSMSKLISFLKSAGKWSKGTDLDVKTVIEACLIRQRFGRPQNKPAVSLPLSMKFNECVAINLHELSRDGRAC